MGKEVNNPCVSLCHLKDGVCTGCGRSKGEIKDWKGMKHKEQKRVAELAATRLKKIRKQDKKR